MSNVIDSDVASAGLFNTPEGASAPGPIGPGGAYTFTVTARPGDRLSFATMFIPSNDLFYAPGADARLLVDLGARVPELHLRGDVTGDRLAVVVVERQALAPG
ncbi:MAG: spondin domain-containing protein, partial [Pseudomonadota bacterium]